MSAVTPETCRVTLQWINICILLHLVGFLLILNYDARNYELKNQRRKYVISMPDNKGYKHTLRICNNNNYCFYTATMVTRTRFNVKLNVHFMSFHCQNLLQNSHIDVLPRTDFLLTYRFALIFIFTYKPIYMYVHNTVNKTLMCSNILISWWRPFFSRFKRQERS